ncbi:DUF294 nucleotidyltransferase-like domain-containing protein [Alterisphingorhabdus coralli]|uniref:DUF294 nucleotidyltransferase-like domain-containing protein n=1 Tax=Alterisphingorhabdus coralli TaxID=3071408 RepID=A0AA97F5V2_9SPHN|nr:DUF294 nucleotidyltransferase-like domain-containing protein [Parasphingorhabdus sp. SCSIO 66989]WOE74939.1 DUF294 nucleotidyltransferase-like domain-containing protein [Parasphingorhabdus sp. SCSIO 66989]
MEVEEVRSFLAQFSPFGALEGAVLSYLSTKIHIRYFRSGSTLVEADAPNQLFSIVRSGAVELRIGGTELNHRLGEGQCFGYPSLLRGDRTRNQVVALEDTLVYQLDADDFLALHNEHQAVQDFFHSDETQRLRKAVEALRSDNEGKASQPMLGVPVRNLLRRTEVATGGPVMSIADCAAIMLEQNVSTLPICDHGRLVGIITDKDLRRRVVAKQLAYDRPVSEIMTLDPMTISGAEQALSAKLIMSRYDIHHLPVTNDAGAIIGVLSANDLLTRLGMNALHVVSEINAAADPAAVAQAAKKLTQVIVHLVDSGVDADHIARFVSAIGEAAHKRLIELAEAALGPPPIPYALVVFGSLARSEQAGGSDQDNGFILDDSYDEAQHGEYFAALAQRLCDGLNSAGYIYCPGDIMATNDKWRQPLKNWLARYRRWIETPDPDNVLNTTIFFDMRCVSGEAKLVDTLREQVLSWSKANRIFVSFIARAAATTRIPLGFFRNFLLEHDEQEGNALDLKHQAIAPLVDIGRVHALAAGLSPISTINRLSAACDADQISGEGSADLADCFEFVRETRFRHQARQIKAGKAPTNNLNPETLSSFEREHLKDAFRLIKTHLENISRRHAGGIS